MLSSLRMEMQVYQLLYNNFLVILSDTDSIEVFYFL